MHSARNGLAGSDYALAHTTDLNNGKLIATRHSITQLRRHVVGPAVLIPRVGLPTSNKCVLYLKRKRLILSDCVIALKCISTKDAKLVRKTLIDNWESFSTSYRSTCAPYITIQELVSRLTDLGIGVEAIVKTKFTSIES